MHGKRPLISTRRAAADLGLATYIPPDETVADMAEAMFEMGIVPRLAGCAKRTVASAAAAKGVVAARLHADDKKHASSSSAVRSCAAEAAITGDTDVKPATAGSSVRRRRSPLLAIGFALAAVVLLASAAVSLGLVIGGSTARTARQ